MKAKAKVHEFDSTSAVFAGDAAQLLGLIDVNETTPSTWRLEDLEAMFRHQMSAPLDFDLSAEAFLGSATMEALNELPEVDKSGTATFGRLFLHPKPPIGLLKLSKDFFKRTAKLHPKDSAEHQVAYLCYLLSVIAARLRHGKRITTLGDSELLTGLDWALKQAWVEKPILKVLVDARKGFGNS